MALLWAAVPAGALPWLSGLDAAKAEASKSGSAILLDFQAVWCYSCYYMEQLLARPAFQQASQGLVLAKLDVDQPEGARLREAFKVDFLPSYVVLSPEGRELGRIKGEQTEADFLAQLAAIRAGSARQGGPALSAVEGLPDCALAYEAMKAEDDAAKLPAAERDAVFEARRKKLEPLVEARVFGKAADRCADLRSAAEALVETYQGLGLSAERSVLLDRAIALFEGLAPAGSPGKDRNLDDNLRYFLEMAGKDKQLDAYYPKLIAAYPEDYVYAYRRAKNLHARRKDQEALPLAEKAASLAYGANRAGVAKVHASILAGLGRKDEARALLEKESSAARAEFPKQAEDLKEELAKLGGSK